MHYNHEKPWRNNRDRLYSMQPNLETKSRSIGLHWFRRRKNGTKIVKSTGFTKAPSIKLVLRSDETGCPMG